MTNARPSTLSGVATAGRGAGAAAWLYYSYFSTGGAETG